MNENIISAVIIMTVFIIITVVADKALKRVESHFDSTAYGAFRLISNSQRAILLFIGAVLAISKLGFDVGALVASLGLTGFALGFALKDAISNLVAGVMIVIYKPIKLGDTIDVTGSKGVVVDLNLRYITIKAESMTHLVPNSILFSNKVSIVDPKTAE